VPIGHEVAAAAVMIGKSRTHPLNRGNIESSIGGIADVLLIQRPAVRQR
jgi:hypothetical protein